MGGLQGGGVMALVVGTDTYISVTDASTYLAANYVSTDAKLTAWTALSSTDKEVLLRKATRIIEQQKIVGFKAYTTQTLAFPRAIWTDIVPNDLPVPSQELYGHWYIQPVVPDAVKYAECEIAIDLVSPSTRKELQRQGVKSFSLGSLSESYGNGSINSLPYEARQLLQPYIAGSVAIC